MSRILPTGLLLLPTLAISGCWLSQEVLVMQDSDTGSETDPTTDGPTDPDTGEDGNWEWIVDDVPTPSELTDLTDVWGASQQSVYVVGKNSTILHWDGTAWDSMDVPDGGLGHLGGVWGTGDDNVFAVGLSGKILHFNGNFWSVMQSGLDYDLYDVCGVGTDLVFAVGSDGIFLALVGGSWVSLPTEHIHDFHSIWCYEAAMEVGTNVYLVGHLPSSGAESTILKFDTELGSFESLPHPSTGKMYAIAGADEAHLYAAGWRPGNLDVPGQFELLTNMYGPEWALEVTGEQLIRDLFSVSQQELWAVGRSFASDDEEGVVLHATGDGWEDPVIFEQASSMEAVWTTDEMLATVFVVGQEGLVARRVWQYWD